MGCDIDDVVCPSHHADVALGVDKSGIAGLVEAWKCVQISAGKFVVSMPQGRQCPWGAAAV